MRYQLVRTVDAAAEPVSAADMREHLRLDSTDQDAYLATLIQAARISLEQETARAFITQTWRMHLRGFWWGHIQIPRSPLASVSSITYTDTDGNAGQVLDSSLYTVTTAALLGEIHTAYGQTLPATRDVPQAVTVEFVAGWGASASDVPADVVHAVKLLAAHLYMHAEPSVTGTIIAEVPDTIKRLVAGFSARGAV